MLSTVNSTSNQIILIKITTQEDGRSAERWAESKSKLLARASNRPAAGVWGRARDGMPAG